jgi:hypothetical protein
MRHHYRDRDRAHDRLHRQGHLGRISEALTGRFRPAQGIAAIGTSHPIRQVALPTHCETAVIPTREITQREKGDGRWDKAG